MAREGHAAMFIATFLTFVCLGKVSLQTSWLAPRPHSDRISIEAASDLIVMEIARERWGQRCSRQVRQKIERIVNRIDWPTEMPEKELKLFLSRYEDRLGNLYTEIRAPRSPSVGWATVESLGLILTAWDARAKRREVLPGDCWIGCPLAKYKLLAGDQFEYWMDAQRVKYRFKSISNPSSTVSLEWPWVVGKNNQLRLQEIGWAGVAANVRVSSFDRNLISVFEDWDNYGREGGWPLTKN